jgi:putative endonuclease
MQKNNQHISTGKKGEELACKFIMEKGFEILETNWRYSHSEVDIIASKENVLYFFEVKTRKSIVFGLPEASVGNKKMTKLKEAAQAYLYKHPNWKLLQFNILSIVLAKNAPPEYFMIEDVF